MGLIKIFLTEEGINWRGTSTIQPKFTTFSDGCEIVTVQTEKCLTDYSTSRVTVSGGCDHTDLHRVALIKQYLDSQGMKDVELKLPYIPNARADRQFQKNAGFSLKVTCDMINAMGFSKVTCIDPHSDVAPALINNIEIIEQHQEVMESLVMIKRMLPEFTLVSPDAGADKKIMKLAKATSLKVVHAYKTRDVATGAITATRVHLEEGETISGDYLIVDDICDGGRTFTELAKVLKAMGAGKVGLFVSHGIFSKGLSPLEDIDYIFSTNLHHKYTSRDELLRFNDRH